MESDPPADALLVCAECGATSPPDAAGWRAYLDDDGAAVTFCPERAEANCSLTGRWTKPGEACAYHLPASRLLPRLPVRLSVFGAILGEAPSVLSVHADDADIADLVAFTDEEDLPSIGRPVR